MKLSLNHLFGAGLGLLLASVPVMAQKSDLASPQERRAVVDLAAKLLKPRELATLPAEVVVPFNPAGFDQPDPEEIKAQMAAAAAAAAAGAVTRPAGDRGVLESLADKLLPSGTAVIGGDPILLFGQKKLKVGDRLTITFEGVDYDLDITAIGRTTFTLRLNREEITRPIKPAPPAKKP